MRTFRELAELLYYANNSMVEKDNQRIYFDPYPESYDFDKDSDENPPSYYVTDTLEDDANVPNSALLISRGPLHLLTLVERLLVQYYRKEKPKSVNAKN